MKKINITVIFLFLITLMVGCEDEKFGYISMDENAGFAKDSLIVYVNPPTSSNQYKYKSPYMTTSIEGVEGTFPLSYGLLDVSGDNEAGAKRLKEIIDVKFGTGLIVIPSQNHNIPVGRYLVSLKVSNVYGSFEIKDVLRVIVKLN